MPLSVFLSFALKTALKGVRASLSMAGLPPTDDFLQTRRGERGEENSLCPSIFSGLVHLSTQKTLQDVIRPEHVPKSLSSVHSPVSFHPWPQRMRFPSCLKLCLLGLFQSSATPSYQLHSHLNHCTPSSLQTCSSPLYPKDGGFLLRPSCHSWISKWFCLHTVYLSPTTVWLLPETGKSYHVPSTGHVLKSSLQ